MTWLNQLLRSRKPSRYTTPLRFRLGAELLEARDVPAVGSLSLTLLKTAAAGCYAPGATVTYTYTITNPLVNPVENVSLVDDNGTPSDTDDFKLTPGTNVAAMDDKGTVDTTDDVPVTEGQTLDAGHSWTFQYAVVLPSVLVDTTITTTATVTGFAGDATATATATATIDICVPTSTPLADGDTATIGFWQNKNGQALINSLNGGPSSTALAKWLVTNFPNLYGTSLTTASTNADVATLFLKNFNVKGAKTDAQVLGAALAVYVTDSDLNNADLGKTLATKYGFNITSSGTGAKVFNVGSYGTAIGLTNNTSYSVFTLLKQADLQKAAGTFNANAFNAIFDGINQSGDII